MPAPIRLGLNRITSLLSRLEPPNPHLALPLIHVAGTNGKGSVCAYLDSILSSASYNTGRFNSPHLVEPRDSICIRGQPLSRERYDSGMAEIEAVDTKWQIDASPFEKMAALCFRSFSEEARNDKMDVAIVEVGMGGRDDATNVHPSPLVSVITAIDLDHRAYLGDTVEEIARVKSGIIKRGRPVVVAPQKHAEVYDVVKQVADELDAPVWIADEHNLGCTAPHSPNSLAHGPIEAKLSLPGRHQVANASTAALVCRLLDLFSSPPALEPLHPGTQSIALGLEKARWPGRLDFVDVQLESCAHQDTPRTRVLVDGAHNRASVECLRDYLDQLASESTLPQQQMTTTFIVSFSHPRDPLELLSPLLRPSSPSSPRARTRVVATRFSPPDGMSWVRPLDPSLIADAATQLGVNEEDVFVEENLRDALEKHAAKSDLAVVCGSLYLVADIYRLAMSRP
jgi:folylpolyglutamate synthase/dihydrofolate synthase